MDEEISIFGEIKRLRNQQPFSPFTLVMSSGDRYDIDNPDTVAFSDTVVVILPPRGASIHLRQSQINAIEEREHAT